VTSEPIDLKAQFPDYLVTLDEAAESPRDPWMYQIRGSRGCAVVYPHGRDLLAIEVNYRPSVAKRLAALPGVSVHQDGGLKGEMTFLVPVADFAAVAKVIRPVRKKTNRRGLEAWRRGRVLSGI
jgi:hypothetical protein